MNFTEREALKKKAMAATPGPWANEDGCEVISTLEHKGPRPFPVVTRTELQWGYPERHLDNAEYIAAASPDVILTLLERIEKLEDSISSKACECSYRSCHGTKYVSDQCWRCEALQGEKGDAS